MSAAAVILAAGASTRMGSPKMLLEIEGRTVIDRAISAVAASCEPVIVVLGYDAARVREAVSYAVAFVVNPDPQAGQLSSLQCGLRAVPPHCDRVAFLPGDFHSVQPATVAALLEALAGAPLALPRCAGRNGHPVVIGRALMNEMLEETVSAREVIHRHAHEAVHVDLDDPGILRDLDTPADYAEALR